MDMILQTIFDTTGAMTMSLYDFLLCMVTSMAIGLFIAFMYGRKNKTSRSFLMTLATLPVAVSMVIIMVNGNIGAGVAVAGAFSLVRFRSMPGSAKEISAIFIAMCSGLTVGMGYIAFAVIFTLIICTFSYILNALKFGESKVNSRILHITIPENLNHSNLFDDIFEKYTIRADMISVKTASMGSLFKLSYELELRDTNLEKELIDDLRCRNGNLEIALTKQDMLLASL